MLNLFEANRGQAVLAGEEADAGLATLDEEGRVRWCNATFRSLLADVTDSPTDCHFVDLMRGNISSADHRVIAEAVRTHRPSKSTVLWQTGAMQPTNREVRLKPLPVGKGTEARFLVTLSDMPGKLSLTEDQNELDAYRHALEHQAIVSATDRRGRIIYVNSQFCAISGYSRSELIGKSHNLINSGFHDPAFFREMWQVISSGQAWHGEVCNRARDGSEYWVDTTVVPVQDDHGKIRRYISIRYDITDRKAAEAKLRKLAQTDPLTGLANRAHFGSRLSDMLGAARAAPDAAAGIVVVFDLDHFKDLNDSYGHPAGDLLLREIGARLASFTTRAATVARLGGDEFAAAIPKSQIPTSLPDFAEKLHAHMSRTVMLGDMPYQPSLSLGLTEFPTDGATVETLFRNADTALYEAKRNGRGRCCLFDPAVRSRLAERTRLKHRLRDALENDAIDIALQPIVASATGAHAGFEVLARMRGPEGEVPRDEFLPLAEELGLIVPLTHAVMQKAFSAAQSWRDKGLCAGYLAVNVAAPQFRFEGFVESIQDLFVARRLDPKNLVIEIAETSLNGRSREKILEALGRLKLFGARIALDDFGTGFSSLSHLRELSVDQIKIGRSFVSDIAENAAGRAMVQAVIAMADGLGLEVVAEGVKTPEQLSWLNRFGCHRSQGYLHGLPMSPDAAEAYLLNTSESRKSA